MACVTHVFSEKEQVVQLCNIQHPYIYTTTLDGALAQRPPAQGRSIPEIAKAATQAAKVRTKMMAYTGDFIFLHGNTRRVVMDDFFWRTCLGSIYIYIPWASEPDKNVGFTSKPEVSKENPRFSNMKLNDWSFVWNINKSHSLPVAHRFGLMYTDPYFRYGKIRG